LTRGKPVELTLSVRWFIDSKQQPALSIEPVRLPTGVKIERFEIIPSGDKISVWITVDSSLRELSDRLCLAGLLRRGQQVYRSAADINVQMLKDDAEAEIAVK